jgi:hypothetical protein
LTRFAHAAYDPEGCQGGQVLERFQGGFEMADSTAGTRRRTGTHRREGSVAKALEKRTSRVPSDIFLWVAGGAVLTAAVLQFMDRRERSLFFGQLVPSLLVVGLYNKVVKLLGSEG